MIIIRALSTNKYFRDIDHCITVKYPNFPCKNPFFSQVNFHLIIAPNFRKPQNLFEQ